MRISYRPAYRDAQALPRSNMRSVVGHGASFVVHALQFGFRTPWTAHSTSADARLCGYIRVWHARGQMNGEYCVGDGHIALVAHCIPVEGVALSVQVQRAAHGVADHIAVLAVSQRRIFFAYAKLRISPTLALLTFHGGSVFCDLQDFYP